MKANFHSSTYYHQLLSECDEIIESCLNITTSLELEIKECYHPKGCTLHVALVSLRNTLVCIKLLRFFQSYTYTALKP